MCQVCSEPKAILPLSSPQKQLSKAWQEGQDQSALPCVSVFPGFRFVIQMLEQLEAPALSLGLVIPAEHVYKAPFLEIG